MLVGVNQSVRMLESAAQGDERSFAHLVREHQSMVFSIAWHFLRNQSMAEELAQDVFLHMYKNLSSIESPMHLTQWLRRVATHRCIDQSRRLKYRPRVGLEDAPEPSSPANHGDPMLSATLERLIQTLPDRPRMVVILRYQEEMEPLEIAQMMDIPIGTVKSMLHRALALLRGKMEREQKGAGK